jgi:aerobic-type carbon monoxide dehydrogenase small subunit (CoxS/CutS family)
MTTPIGTPESAPARVEITILGRRCLARPDVTLVWALYDEGHIESGSQFCWNGSCLSCMVTVVAPGDRASRLVKACEIFPIPGLAVVSVSGSFRVSRRFAA